MALVFSDEDRREIEAAVDAAMEGYDIKAPLVEEDEDPAEWASEDEWAAATAATRDYLIAQATVYMVGRIAWDFAVAVLGEPSLKFTEKWPRSSWTWEHFNEFGDIDFPSAVIDIFTVDGVDHTSELWTEPLGSSDCPVYGLIEQGLFPESMYPPKSWLQEAVSDGN